MVTRDKRLEAMRRNPRNVRFETLRRVLEDHGFTSRRSPGRDHWRFSHRLIRTVLTVDPRRPFLLVPYVTDALKAIDEADEATEREAQDGDGSP